MEAREPGTRATWLSTWARQRGISSGGGEEVCQKSAPNLRTPASDISSEVFSAILISMIG
jgi:hypothetical protein